jgi:1-acyl-sn-glycerol-3-phosphate acyltransferase
MANHRSHFDVLAVMDALSEFQLRWVAKKELTEVPIFGWALQHTDHIIIDRTDHAQAVASLRAARAQMERGVSVIIFPEGTRSEPDDLEMLPFKKGGFMLALETGFPIVPIAIRGSALVLPKGGWEVADGDIDVVVGAPIASAGVDRETLMTRVRERMDALLELPAVPGVAAARLAEVH